MLCANIRILINIKFTSQNLVILYVVKSGIIPLTSLFWTSGAKLEVNKCGHGKDNKTDCFWKGHGKDNKTDCFWKHNFTLEYIIIYVHAFIWVRNLST